MHTALAIGYVPEINCNVCLLSDEPVHYNDPLPSGVEEEPEEAKDHLHYYPLLRYPPHQADLHAGGGQEETDHHYHT